MFDKLQHGSKAELALELIDRFDPNSLKPPLYIEEGLRWLEKMLCQNPVGDVSTEQLERNDAEKNKSGK